MPETERKPHIRGRHIVAHFYFRLFRNFSFPPRQNRPQNFVEIVPRIVLRCEGKRPGVGGQRLVVSHSALVMAAALSKEAGFPPAQE